MSNPGVAQRELARRAAPVCYALRKARLPRLPLRCGGSAERDAAQPEQDVGNVLVRTARRIRPRDARRVDAHRARLAARGLRCKAPPFVPRDYIFDGPGDGSVPAKRGRKGRKALRAAHRREHNGTSGGRNIQSNLLVIRVDVRVTPVLLSPWTC